MNLDNYKKCPKCGELMKQIPIKRFDKMVIIECYCERCDESLTLYPTLGEVKFRKVDIFSEC